MFDRKNLDALVNEFERAYDKISAMVQGLSPEAMAFVPNLPDAWSINAHLVHLLDADCNMVMRVRGAVAEPGKLVPVWDAEAWQKQNRYNESDGLAALNIAISLRAFLAASLRSLDDAALEAAHIIHPERGTLQLADVLKIYADHPAFHVEYVERNLSLLKK